MKENDLQNDQSTRPVSSLECSASSRLSEISRGGRLPRYASNGARWISLLLVGALTSLASIAGDVVVTEGGTPSYSAAVAVPPGIGGMVPQVAITYTGSPVNGPLGYGWTLQGLSTITRCPYTKAIDGVAHGVDYGVSDKLCLDGQRLIQTDGACQEFCVRGI